MRFSCADAFLVNLFRFFLFVKVEDEVKTTV